MTFDKTLKKYKKNKKFKNSTFIKKFPQKEIYDFFIIIPCYYEKSYIDFTLETISMQNQDLLECTLVIVVINNASSEKQIIKDNNRDTYISLYKKKFNFELILIDCYSSQYALPDKLAGVGLARKIGLDFCIDYAKNQSLFCSIDADTLLAIDYLSSIDKEYKKYQFKWAIVDFKHQKNSERLLQEAISTYESLLKNIALHLYQIGSPYGFVSMGSTIICTMQSYIAVGGMPPKRATEDFYFLQKLAKYHPIHRIKKILVYPSSRAEERVYLGTGYRMINVQKNKLFNDLYINPKAYDELQYLYKIIEDKWNGKSIEIMSSLAKNYSKLHRYLEKNNFINTFKKIQKNETNQTYFMTQFHRWFDSLKIYKFLRSYDK